MPNFTADWIVEGSFPDTLRNLINKAEPGALAGRSPEQITEALLDELRFISVYDEEDEKELKKYLQQREQYGREVIARIGSELQQLGPEPLHRIAKTIAALANAKASAVDSEILAVATAVHMVSFPDVNVVIGSLVGLMADMNADQKTRIAEIITYLLPFNYAPGVIRELKERVGQGQLGLVEDTVSNRTLAEVIMAGYDGKPVTYTRRSDNGELLGKTGIPLQDEPEEGPNDPHAPNLAVLRAARNLVLDLVALKDITFSLTAQAQRPGVGGDDTGTVERELDTYATRLRGAFKGISKIHGGRSVYCVLTMPQGRYQRIFRKEVLGEVAKRIPLLLFVELAPNPPGLERDFEVQEYIKHLHLHVIPL